MKGQRIMRFIGNREVPEPHVYDLFVDGMFGIDVAHEEEKQEEPFEVNLTEPLVGWRRWIYCKPFMSKVYGLRSFSQKMLWRPGEAFKAKCLSLRTKDELTPTERCTCGIYAVDNINNLPSNYGFSDKFNTVTGLVYGWGRYVRGENGWRCQFAYPKEFHLRSFQTHLIEPLKEFRVPIFIDDPVKIYNPEDEGYTSEYRPNQENGDLRAATDSNS